MDVHSDSVYATEGTVAHLAAATEAGWALGLIEKDEYREETLNWRDQADADGFDTEEMQRHAEAYADLLVSLRNEHEGAQVFLEQQVQTGVPGCWGTGDAVLVAPGLVHVVDYKYGIGIPVSADDNPQLKLYGVGALETFGVLGDFKRVRMTIHQPRLDSVSHASISARKLLEWRDREVAPLAQLALSEDAYLKPSETACRFCPAAGQCRTRAEYMTKRDFGDPDLLTPAEIADNLERVDDLENWCKSIREAALYRVYTEGIEIPGWKAVRAAGRRTITDAEKAIHRLMRAGFKKAEISRTSTKTLADLERVVGGKDELQTILGPLLVKPAGKVSMVREEDPREAVDAASEAAADFTAK